MVLTRVQMKIKLATLTALLLLAAPLIAQAPSGDRHQKTPQVCQLISANPPDFDLLQFIPKKLDFTRLNRFPLVEFVVNEDGSVSNVKIRKGTRSPKVDAGLVKSIQAWKYKPQPGCKVEVTMSILIDIG